MPKTSHNSSMEGLNWKSYLKRIRFAFGDRTDLANAYCDGYEAGIKTGYTATVTEGEKPDTPESTYKDGNANDVHKQGFHDALEDMEAQILNWR